MNDVPIPRDSPAYQEFKRLHDLAHQMRPGSADRWNGDLYASSNPTRFGALDPQGNMRLSQTLVLDHLSGATDPSRRAEQAQAIATVLHESLHSRVPMDDPGNPDAQRNLQSRALDEGLTEYQTVSNFQAFADLAGYQDLPTPPAQYDSAYVATTRVLDYAAGPDTSRRKLADRALDAPVSMRFNALADEIVRTRLDGVVPPEPQHQQAARAEVSTALADMSWQGLAHSGAGLGGGVARESIERVERAVGRIEQHYQQSPDRPYGAAPAAGSGQGLGGEQQRLAGTAEGVAAGPPQQAGPGQGGPAQGERGPVDLAQLPPAEAAARLEGVAAQGAQVHGWQEQGPPVQGQQGQGQAMPGQMTAGQPGQVAAGQRVPVEMRAAFSGQAPAAGAVQSAPKLGDGSRGSSGAEATAGRSVGPRNEPTGRDRD
ncbi:hypothetical protein [Kribbella deserti]|uniref:Uncharacterized protein n=1 Tax=Kribbella deserti TaxID=1926257 RepID=A0ABV6QUV3_9ACTN